jgi:hypothetical protein
MKWLYPEAFDPLKMSNSAIICSLNSNEDVDEWNKKIQLMNPNTPISLYSRDVLAEVDDPNDVLKNL